MTCLPNDAPPIRILIIGAGISGLLNYIYLTAHLPSSIPYTIRLVEAYDAETRRSSSSLLSTESAVTHITEDPTAPPIGGGLGLAPNALRNLKRLDPTLHAELVAAGYPIRRFEIRSAWGFRLGHLEAAEAGGEDGERTVMMLRQVVWQILKKRVPDGVIGWGRKATKLRRAEEFKGCAKTEVYFEDGSKEVADLVIGADGLRSCVREYIMGEGFQAKFE